MRVSRPERGGLGRAGLAVGVALLVLALLPTPVSGWVTALRGPLQTVVGPVSGPLSIAASTLRPAERRRQREEAGLEEMRRQRDRYEVLWRQSMRRVQTLEERLASLEGWRAEVGPRVRTRWARVIGRELEAGTVSVRVGGAEAVPVGTVAVDAASRQLVGRVVGVGPSAVTVRLITATGGERRWLRSVLFPPEGAVDDATSQAALPRVDLEATPGGSFRSAPVGVGQEFDTGGLVRLDDPAWPSEAQLLVVGRVAAVEPVETPLMRRLTVRPTVDDLGSLPWVVLLVPGEDHADDEGSAR